MGKYEPLGQFLRRRTHDRWSASFAEIEAVLGHALPKSARDYPAWWANQHGAGHSQTSWLDAGWKTCNVDLKRGRVDFERAGAPRNPAALDDTDTLIARAAELSGIGDRDEVIREALRALIEREGAKKLIALGGTMADFAAPSRRRPVA